MGSSPAHVALGRVLTNRRNADDADMNRGIRLSRAAADAPTRARILSPVRLT